MEDFALRSIYPSYAAAMREDESNADPYELADLEYMIENDK